MDVDLAGLGAALSWLRKLLRLQTISGQSLTPPQFPLATVPNSRTPHRQSTVALPEPLWLLLIFEPMCLKPLSWMSSSSQYSSDIVSYVIFENRFRLSALLYP